MSCSVCNNYCFGYTYGQVCGSQGALLSLQQFLLICPEFKNTDYALIVATMQEAARELEPCVWGSQLANGHKYLTAHKLCMSPMGQMSRLIAKDGDTTYHRHFNDLVKKLPVGVGIT